MAIFNYTNRDGGELEILDRGSDLLFLVADADGAADPVQVKRDDVIRLHTALGAWISGDNVPVCDADSLYGQLIRQAVHEELARVIPECLAQTQAPQPSCQHCQDDGYECRPGETDPEPHDVGHPTYEDARPLARVGPSHCGECTHPMNDHIAFGGCWGNAGTCACEVQQDAPVPVVKSDKVWGEAGQAPVQCTCAHPAADHHRKTQSWEGGCLGCMCEWAGTS